MSPAPTPAFAERLRVPASWWAIGMGLALPVAAALGIYLGWWQVVALVVLSGVGVAAALLSWGSGRVVVDETGLRAADSRIGWEHVAGATPHDADATRARLGAEADARAWLVVRPWLRTSVEVTLADASDPHPYWLVSTRRPLELAEAVNARARGKEPA